MSGWRSACCAAPWPAWPSPGLQRQDPLPEVVVLGLKLLDRLHEHCGQARVVDAQMLLLADRRHQFREDLGDLLGDDSEAPGSVPAAQIRPGRMGFAGLGVRL